MDPTGDFFIEACNARADIRENFLLVLVWARSSESNELCVIDGV
jgi:hypothetical protein